MRFGLPDYVINLNLLKAVERDNVGYVSGTVNHYPWLRTALFYSEQTDATIGLFENFFKPPLVLVITLFIHAIRHNSTRVVEFLGLTDYDENCGYVVDDIGDEDPSNESYRVHKLPALCFCNPKSSGYKAAISAGLDAGAQIQLISRTYTGPNYNETKVVYNGFWEFSIGVSKQTMDPNRLNELTNQIFASGYDCNRILRVVDFSKLFSHYLGLKPDVGFTSPESIMLACYFIQIFIKHGCLFSDKGMTYNILNVLSYIINYERHTSESENLAESTFRSIMTLIQNTKFVSHFSIPNISNFLNLIEHNSLKNICLRYIRFRMGSKHFASRVNKLPIDSELKQFLINAF